jgi:hypothetical protein
MSTIRVVKAAAGWIASEQNVTRVCQECAHMEWRVDKRYFVWCKRHGFRSLSKATCNDFQSYGKDR